MIVIEKCLSSTTPKDRESDFKTDFKCSYLNVRSINPEGKLDSIKEVLDRHGEVDLICFVETWMEQDDTKFNKIKHYNDFHYVRKKKGGGISIYMKSKIKCLKFDTYGDIIQIVHMKLKIDNRVINLLVCYNPSINELENCINLLSAILAQTKSEPTYVVGDFNVDLNKPSKKREEYLNAISMLGFNICNKEVTRKVSLTTIDHIMTNIDKGNMNILNIEMEDEVSDHNMLIWTMPSSFKSAGTDVRNIVQYDKLQDYLELNQMDVESYHDTEELSNDFHSFMEKAIKDSEKKQEVKENNFVKLNPWANKELANLCKFKQELQKKKKIYPDNKIISDYYLTISKAVNKLKTKLKKDFVDRKIDKGIERKLNVWEVLKEVSGSVSTSSSDICQIKDGDNIIVDEKSMANKFNEFFINVGPNLAKKLPDTKDTTLPSSSCSPMKLSYTTREEVTTIIANLANKNSSPNKLSNILIKKSSKHMVPIMVKMINCSYDQGIFPSKCKMTVVKPLYKSGDPMTVDNYRPISITSSPARINELAMKSRLEEHLANIGFFYTAQYGFLKSKDAQGAIFDLVAKIQKALDFDTKCAAIFIDLRKAFDTVNHNLLLSKLSKIGIVDKTLDWFKSYLSGRPQQVKCGNTLSDVMMMLCGVPQGSILGPILFLIYINDIGKLSLKGKVQLFADDAVLIYEASYYSQLEKLMSEDLKILFKWFSANKLSLNISKTNYIIFKKKYGPEVKLDIKINNQSLNQVKNVKYLGITLDEHLAWKDHIGKLSPKLRATSRLIFKLRKILDINKLKTLYYAYFHSHISYMCFTWGLSYHTSSIKILQNGIIKNILNVNRMFSTKQVYWVSSIMPFEALVNASLVILLYNHIQGRKLINTDIQYNHQFHNHSTRASSNFRIPKINTTHYGTQGSLYQAIKLFNSMPQEVLDLTDYRKFKSKCKSVFFQKFVQEP